VSHATKGATTAVHSIGFHETASKSQAQLSSCPARACRRPRRGVRWREGAGSKQSAEFQQGRMTPPDVGTISEKAKDSLNRQFMGLEGRKQQ
jgi:hypothetical protein